VKEKSKKSPYESSRAIEREFQRALQKIARASGGIVEGHVNGADLQNIPGMKRALEDYSRALTPWAKKQSQKLLGDTMKRLKSDKAYQAYAKKMGKELSKELFESEIGLTTMALVNEQVNLIKSIPIEAGERAQKLALEGLAGGRRADEIASELMKTTEVTESRAKLIARTETARANTALNLARSTSVGSTQYVWRTSGDADVRPSHRKMNGKVFEWNDPPTLEDGMTGHPGTFPNCRCYAEPILPDE
jgi:SPP1 gp7 family putative phage head morphogenesis protein